MLEHLTSVDAPENVGNLDLLPLRGLAGGVMSEDMEEQFAGMHLRVLAPARPGYGASDYFEMNCMADWPRQRKGFLDNLGLYSFDACVISAGAPYGYVLAAVQPETGHLGEF